MPILVPCRGSVYKVNPTEDDGESGFFEIEGLSPKKGPGDALLINSVNPQESDIVLPIVTLENTGILYSFGSNFGDISISGMVLLGKAGAPGESLQTLIDFFDSNRVSKKPEPTTVTGPSSAWNVFLIGLAIGEADSSINAQSFSFTGKIAKPK
jgi:hypothetical protein